MYEPAAKANQRKSGGRGKKAEPEKGCTNLDNLNVDATAKAAEQLNVGRARSTARLKSTARIGGDSTSNEQAS